MTAHKLRGTDYRLIGGLDFKPSNIRIWIHNRDIGKLQHVLWEGHGSKLRCETSSNPRVKRFLEAVPFIMTAIKDIHAAVIKNDIEGFRKRVEEPVSPIILSSKDSNGLNVLHKAAGLGYVDLAKEIVERYPVIVNAQDNDGRTPLHYAAVCRDGGAMYDTLVSYAADESKLDNKHKAPAYYKNRPMDVDLSSLVMIPEAPRVSGTYPRHWDWRIIDSDAPAVPRVKRAPTNANNNNNNNGQADEDSAFESAESAKLSEELASPEMENGEDELIGNDDDDDEKPEKKENEEEGNETPASAEAEENAEVEATENPEGETAEQESDEVNADDNNNEEEDKSDEPEPDEKAENEPEETEEPEDTEKPEETENPEEEGEPKNEEEIPTATEEPGTEDEPNENEAEDGPNEYEAKDEPNENEAEDKPEEGETEDKPEKSETEDKPDEDDNEDKPEEAEDQPDSGVGATPDEEEQIVIGGEGSNRQLPGAGMAVDEETAEILENGTMEQLAAIVLTGEGHRLVGRTSSSPELQAFIDNVPSYISKIRAVHKASMEGNLKDLQTSLDRRKFAIAKDLSSPHGATPLHVAVIFGHTPVVRYLAGRFPETAHALDLDGRTPLHYAATLADNGHYYNLLLNLGANPLVQDNFGHKADFYKQNQDDLSHKQLLRDFGVPENIAEEMLVDKDLKIFQDGEGQYLASSLGDPLLKGLTEVASNKPKDPVTYLATYLYNFANKDKPMENIKKESNGLIIPNDKGQSYQEENQAENRNNDDDDDDGYPQSPDFERPESLFAELERDDSGQTSLHFAANRPHGKDGLYSVMQEKEMNIALRDSRYRTARDVAEVTGNRENVRDIDRYVVYLAARDETNKLVELLMEGYNHIIDCEDDGKNIIQIAEEQGCKTTVDFLKTVKNFTEQRDEIHRAVRAGDALRVRELFESNGDGARLLAQGKNIKGRCSLHVAVLHEHVDIVRYIAKNYPATLRIGDNLERTALHYAMGVSKVDTLSHYLIRAGAKRVEKDLKLRQPTYYFMNTSDIKQLQEEEEELES